MEKSPNLRMLDSTANVTKQDKSDKTEQQLYEDYNRHQN